MDDKNITELFFKRSEQAITELMKKYGRICLKCANGILYSAEDSEECVNSACMKMWNAIPPKNPENLGGYFIRAVRNIAISTYRKEKSRSENELDNELFEIIPDSNTLEKQYDSNRISELINEFLEKEKKKNRSIFVSRYYLNLSLSDIGESLGMSESAVKSRLHRIRTDLRKFLTERGVEI